MKNYKTITITVLATFILVSSNLLFNSCAQSDEIELSHQPMVDSIYNQIYGLYVIDDDTTAYSNNDKDSKLTEVEKSVGLSLAEYAVKMLIDYGRTNTDNTILSPLCATTLYSLMSNFTNTAKSDINNEYKKEINASGSSTEELNSYHRKITSQIENSNLDDDFKTDFSVKNDIYMKEGATVYRSFITTSNSYGVGVKGIRLDNGAGLSEINKSIEQHTGSSGVGINNISNSNLNSLVSSSLSFKQFWKEPFYVDSVNCRFKNVDGDSIKCKILFATRQFHFAHYSSFDMIEIPYKDDNFSMYVMLPHQNSTLNASLSDLYLTGLNQCITYVSDTTRTYHNEKLVNDIDTLISDTIVNIHLPIFKHNATVALYSQDDSNNTKKVLYETNLPKVSTTGFKLGNIYQSCQLEITIDGTSAIAKGTAEVIEKDEQDQLNALALGSGIKTNYIVIPADGYSIGGEIQKGKKIKETIIEPFHIDRPFALFIRNHSTGTIPFSVCIKNVQGI